MKTYTVLFVLAVFAGLILFAISTPAQQRPALANTWQIKPQAMPTSLTDVSSLGTNVPANTDLYLCQIRINSLSANVSDVAVTIQDKQATPVPFWDGYPISPGVIYERIAPNPDGCAYFPGGISILAGSAGVRVAMSGRY